MERGAGEVLGAHLEFRRNKVTREAISELRLIVATTTKLEKGKM